MASELKIPEVGESITEVQIARWLKAEGDVVKADEAVAVIDSEKTTFELPSPAAGRLSKILHQAGDRVRVGDVVAEIEASNGETKEKPGPKKEAKPGQKETAKAPEKKAAPESKKAEPAPVEEETAKEEQVEEPEVKEESQPARKAEARTPEPKAEKKPVTGTDDGGSETVPMTMLRKTVARRLVEAQQTMAMLTTFNEIDMSAVQALRHEHQEAFEKRHQVKLGLMSFFVKVAIDALKQAPQLNAEIRGEDIVYHSHFDIGVAIATERGLVVPVLRGAERMSFAEVEKKIGEFGARAKGGQLNPEDLTGGTFTITNGGVFGSLLSTPIINPPQSGILGMHTIQDRPVAIGGQVVIRPMMYVALTYDHRLVDGREAVVFLKRVKEVIENPARMLLEI